MATKEDILEQMVEEYLIHRGYFVQHNIRYLPLESHPDFDRKKDSNHSDIDVLGFKPTDECEKKVVAVNCKSWQTGFNPTSIIKSIEEKKILSGKDAWKGFRELTSDKWSDAFIKIVREKTGETKFTHITAVTRLKGGENGKRKWENHKRFRCALQGNSLQILTLSEMVDEILNNLTKTLARTEIGRILQLLNAAKIDLHNVRK